METAKEIFKYFIWTCLCSAGALIVIMGLHRLMKELIGAFKVVL